MAGLVPIGANLSRSSNYFSVMLREGGASSSHRASCFCRAFASNPVVTGSPADAGDDNSGLSQRLWDLFRPSTSLPATIPGSSPGTGMTSLNIRRLALVLWPITTDRTLTANRRFRGTPEVRVPMPTAGGDANDPQRTTSQPGCEVH
jgi:hypothetical protein